MENILDVDGSILEGGGQILRMSVAFSALMTIPVRIYKIRFGRSKPGLAAQHLTGIQLVANMCNAKVKGAELGSTEITFIPGKICGGKYSAEVRTAGAISLLLQVALPFALLSDAPVTMDLKGGTDVDMAPQIGYMSEVFRVLLERFGGSFDLDLHKRGYYPRGGGHVTVLVTPVKQFSSVCYTDSGILDKVFGWSFVSGNLPIKVANEMAESARIVLNPLTKQTSMEAYREATDIAPHSCSGILLVGESTTGCIFGGSGLGSRNIEPKQVGFKAAQEIYSAIANGACLDDHAQDQVILYMALAHGKSAFKVNNVTMHTRTAIHVAEMFTQVKFNITPSGNNNIIECEGIGYVNTGVTKL